MKIKNVITVEGDLHKNDRGTHEWGSFKILSSKPLSNETLRTIAAAHGFAGQTVTVSPHTIENNNHEYKGSFDCWSD